ncbi:uncharacterized protein LOC117584541 [Drosophila guanche]|uniref:Uncharacterized protein n=1 Tax=Drosophila guanche TaxID=7266 RepID=A0A3B0JPD7_DROGU|nr:uncharacterized protein LOC117584541 [Drosophila guanche]SPP82222.1 Hypothetical predicted protein [Drosophila guanche]
MADIDCEPFNPFNVGPPNSGQRVEFKIPTSPTYPPPVFAIMPQDKQGYVKQSISQESAPASRLKLGQSKMGKVAVSQAINEEMAAAKQQAAALDDEERFDAGGISKLRLPNSKSNIDSTSKGQSKVSVKTLLPVRSQRQAKNGSTSGSSVGAKASKVSRASTRSRVSTGSSIKSRSSSASKQSKKSQSSNAQSSTAASLGRSSSRACSKLNPRSTTDSSVTLTSKLAKQHSKVESVKASSSKDVSRSSRTSKTIEKPTERASENLSQHSVQSKTKDATSTVPKSKKNESSATLKSKIASSKASLKDKVKPANKIKSVKTLAEETSLIDQAAKFTERLKAGDEDNFRRYSSLMNNYSRRVPEKLFREDRMSFWFQDAVL